jgi:hypothetical protein
VLQPWPLRALAEGQVLGVVLHYLWGGGGVTSLQIAVVTRGVVCVYRCH